MPSGKKMKAGRILIVDDQVTIIHVLSKLLTEDYHIIATTKATETFNIVEKNELPDLVILDINMPEISGFELCQQLKSNSLTKDIPIIFISACDSIDEELKGFEIGASDYIKKPFQPVIVKARVREIMETQLARKKLKESNNLIQKELAEKRENLAKAQKIQQRLNKNYMPLLTEYAIKAWFLPSEELGGDFLSIRKEEEYIIFILGDCEGHGIEASLDSVLAKSTCDHYISLLKQCRPDKFLEEINKEMIYYLREEKFLTIFTGILDTRNGEFTYANGNGEMPCLIRKGEITFLENPKGMFIGYDASNLGFKFKKKKIQLQDNDILFFYSDALRELKIEGECLGREGITDILQKFGNGIDKDADFFFQTLRKYSELPLVDDLSIIFCQFSRPIIIEKKIKTLDDFNIFSTEISDLLLKKSFHPDDISSILISFLEMFVNALEHGNKNLPDVPVEIKVSIDFEKIEIDIKDSGEGFDPEKIPNPTDIDRLLAEMDKNEIEKFTHGRGIWMAKRFMDNVQYNNIGNNVTISKIRNPGETQFSFSPFIKKK